MVLKDKENVERYGKAHDYKSKIKRKSRENKSLREEIVKRQRDINKNFTYCKGIGCTTGELLPKEKSTSTNICIHALYGCSGYPRHKTERSKHCFFFQKSGLEIQAAKQQYILENSETTI